MRKLLDSGVLFLVVALLNFIAAILAENGAVFVSVGAFWLIMAMIVRSRNAKKADSKKNDTAT